MSAPRVSKRALQALLDRSAFVAGWGFRVKSVSDDACTVALPWREELARPGGVVNGPAFMALADCAMWLAIKRRLGMDQDAVTADLYSAFLSPARRETVYCTARILKLGKRLVYGVAECHDARGRLFTHHTITYARIGT